MAYIMPNMKITIAHGRKEYPLKIQYSATVLQIKLQIEDLLDIPTTQQSLWLNGEYLKNEYRVQNYELFIGDKITLELGIPVIIKTSTTEYTLTVQDIIRVDELKEKIREQTGIPTEGMQLKVGNRVMDDRRVLSLYDIHAFSEINMHVSDAN